jgi:O-acetyl-ADP-ribose deacetylase (regulator of RNase III)
MPTLEHRDILDVQKGIIVHQINPFTMGAGLALAIRKRYPKHYEDFVEWRKSNHLSAGNGLGRLVLTTHYAPLYIVGMCAQEEYGRKKKEYTDYDAFKGCLNIVDYLALKYNTRLYIPYKIGCGLAGGKWSYILYYISHITPYAIICKLGRPTDAEKEQIAKNGKIYL